MPQESHAMRKQCNSACSGTALSLHGRQPWEE